MRRLRPRTVSSDAMRDETASMTDRIDLEPAAQALLRTLEGVEDEHLERSSPCFGHPVAEVLQHLVVVTEALRAVADKDLGPLTEQKVHPPQWPALQDGWREAIRAQVPAMVRAWSAEPAWEGTTRAGGLEMPAEVAGRIAVDELVLHGWDLARATGQSYALDEDIAAASLAFVRAVEEDAPEPLGPPVEVGDDVAVLDRLVALSGRDPHWSAP